MAYQLINYEKKNKVARITLNTPPLNWLTIVMMKEINDALVDVKRIRRSSCSFSTTQGRRRFPTVSTWRTTPMTRWKR